MIEFRVTTRVYGANYERQFPTFVDALDAFLMADPPVTFYQIDWDLGPIKGRKVISERHDK
jgi:hypothetical protein